MRILEMSEVQQVSGGVMSWDEGANLILVIGALGGPATMLFAIGVAGGMYLATP